MPHESEVQWNKTINQRMCLLHQHDSSILIYSISALATLSLYSIAWLFRISTIIVATKHENELTSHPNMRETLWPVKALQFSFIFLYQAVDESLTPGITKWTVLSMPPSKIWMADPMHLRKRWNQTIHKRKKSSDLRHTKGVWVISFIVE